MLLSLATVNGGTYDATVAWAGSEPATCPAEVFDYPWSHEEACAVSYCESRWQADAVGGDNWGAFQLWSGWAVYFGLPSRDALLDRATNVRLAHAIWQREGWGAWACKPW